MPQNQTGPQAGAATIATTVGGYATATAVGVDAVNTSVEVATRTNYIAKGAYKLFGNENRTEEDFFNLYGEGGDNKPYTLLQTKGQLNGIDGIYEYITNDMGQVTHQRFIEGGIYMGFSNQKIPKGDY